MKRVGFITHRGLPHLTDDDALTIEPLRDAGVEVEPLVWDDPSVRWDAYDALVLRSCWDYHRRPGEFAAWIARLRFTEANLWNSPGVVLWNMDKSYLADLEEAGIRIPRTVFLPAGTSVDLAGVLEDAGMRDAILKPTVSATAWRTSRVSIETAGSSQESLDAMLQSSGAMVQEYAPEIGKVGEWSLVFLGGRYSHGVLKVPRQGEFRVQADFGGGTESCIPSAHLVAQAVAVVEAAGRIVGRTPGIAGQTAHPAGQSRRQQGRDHRGGPELLYARVDGVERQGRLVLMELEALEPELFFRADAAAPGRFAAAVQAICLRDRG